MGRRALVVTVSDGVSSGHRQDESGDVAAEILGSLGLEVERAVVPDEQTEIEKTLRAAADEGVELVVTTGGTGFGPRDVTPEATRAVIEREAPGLAELSRRAGLEKTPMAALSRGIAGTHGTTLIVNLPGSPKAVNEGLEALIPVLPHALETQGGHTSHDPRAEHPHGGHHERRGSGAAVSDEVRVIATAVKIHGSPPCVPGQRLAIGEHGPLEGTLGCSEFDSAAITDAPWVSARGEAVTRTYDHELGSVEVFLEPISRQTELIIFAATPVSAHLLALARSLGYRTVLVESRSDRVTAEHRRLSDEVVESVSERTLSPETLAVHTDHDAPNIVDNLQKMLASPAAFIGVMGSRSHVGKHVQELRAAGVTEEDLGRLRSPLGLDLGGRTPEEIAVSIAAGLIAARHGRDGGWLDRPELE